MFFGGLCSLLLKMFSKQWQQWLCCSMKANLKWKNTLLYLVCAFKQGTSKNRCRIPAVWSLVDIWLAWFFFKLHFDIPPDIFICSSSVRLFWEINDTDFGLRRVQTQMILWEVKSQATIKNNHRCSKRCKCATLEIQQSASQAIVENCSHFLCIKIW